MANFGTDFLLGQGTDLNYEIMRKCNWYVDIDTLGIRLAVQEVTVPRIELEQVEVFFYNDRVKVASKPNTTELEVTVLDYVSPNIVQQLWAWSNSIYNTTTRNMGYAKDYKKQGMVLMNDPTGILVRTWTCKGIWPTNTPVQSDALSYEGGHDVIKIEMKFSCDLVTLDGQSAGGSAGSASPQNLGG